LVFDEGAALFAVTVCKEIGDGKSVELDWEAVPVVVGTDTSARYARIRSGEEGRGRW